MFRRTGILAFLTMVALARSSLATAAVVYDNTTTYRFAENELLPSGHTAVASMEIKCSSPEPSATSTV